MNIFNTLSRTAIALLIGLASVAHADNPIITTEYSADPSAHIFGGRMYIYASHDRKDAREFDMVDYHVYSSGDLKNWQDHGAALSVADIPWAKAHLWAPDCAFKDGMYYLYFPVDTTGKYNFRVGVASSKSPVGPFKPEPGPIAGVDGIDPSVFVDDDGQAYIIWAAGVPVICKLKPNMKELDGAPVRLAGCDKFFEGPWIFKRDGLYYLTYPAFMKGGSGDGGNGQYYDYATAKTILGPYKYRGHFTQTQASQSWVGNIHGAQLEWKGKWYCIYHDAGQSAGHTNPGFKRSVNIDLLNFGSDGSIQPLIWTKTGPPQIASLNPYMRNEAETLGGSDIPEGPHAVATEPCSEGGMDVGQIEAGDWVKYAGVDFGKGASQFEVRVTSPIDGGKIELHLDRLDGPIIGVCSVPNTGGWQTWQTAECAVNNASGKHDLYFKFMGPGTTGLFNIDWYRFTQHKKGGVSKLSTTETTPFSKIVMPAARNPNWPGGLPLTRLLDIPMRDPNITLGPDGYYYLVGTTDPAPGYTTIGSNDLSSQMWTINDGIRMWKSRDLEHWESLGLIWSLDKDGAGTWVNWWPKGTNNPGTAIWAPEIHYLKGTYWMPYCTKLPGEGLHLACGLLKSVTGKPEGPYRDVQPDKPLGLDDDASLFEDTDGTVYYLFAGYKIARMKPDMSGLAEEARDIKFAQPPGWGEGIFMVKVNGKYIFINSGTASFDPQGLGTAPAHVSYDSYSAVSTGSIYGPYTVKYRAIPHAGHNNLFQDKRGKWWSTYFGSDPHAPFSVGASGRASIMPVTINSDGTLRFSRESERPQWRYTTDKPGDDWNKVKFSDKGWKLGDGAFGDPKITEHGEVTDIGTNWTGGDIWLRKTFSVKTMADNPSLYIRHNGPIQVYLNGLEVASEQGDTEDYITVPISDAKALRSGPNTIAVHCASKTGLPDYVDVGLVDVK